MGPTPSVTASIRATRPAGPVLTETHGACLGLAPHAWGRWGEAVSRVDTPKQEGFSCFLVPPVSVAGQK